MTRRRPSGLTTVSREESDDSVTIASPRKMLSISSPRSSSSSPQQQVVPRQPMYHYSPVCNDPCAVCGQRSCDSTRPKPKDLMLAESQSPRPSAVICEPCYCKHSALLDARKKWEGHERAYLNARICLEVKARDGELPERPRDFSATSSIGGLWPRGHNPEAATRVL